VDIVIAISQPEPPSLVSITQPLALVLLPCSNLCVPLLVDSRMHGPNDRHNNQIHDQVRQSNGVSNNIPRAVTWSVELCSNNRADVSDSDLHSIGRCALRLAADVDGRPGETECNGGVDAGGRKESTDVGDSGLLLRVCVTEENAVADDSNC